ncbi:uncharacterized protein C21orf58 homolog [Varanus komodoensis]|uniref:uncharacterized protein C21orf58 homolog n=1 Tax=Varanus komodoensis TaxID=61221 RepID=UPI001CF7922E|nr:uncharacterized protein C21orf58 homolog [Varanus komodoensis]
MDSDVADHLTRMKIKLLEKLKRKLENECENLDDFESPFPAASNYSSHDYALQSALRRRKDLLQQLREQKLLEEFSLPHGSLKIPKKHFRPEHVYQTTLPPPPPPPPPILEQPRIIQQTLPQQPATIIQQIPQYPPLITQIPPPQASVVSRSGSIKEDMVEMMLMQNAQMHQIIMQNMMLKSLPPPVHSSASGHGISMLQHGQQFTTPILLRAEKPRPSTVHHHHYAASGLLGIPSPSGFSIWPSIMQASSGTQLGGFSSDLCTLPIPTTGTQTIPANRVLGLPPGL